VDDALAELAAFSPRLAQVVECRYFAGYTAPETADALGLSLATVERDWAKARAWLFQALRDGG
jgi:RNA polymerase sigma factor (sigma-70 family)